MGIVIALCLGIVFTLTSVRFFYDVLVNNLLPFLAYKRTTIANSKPGKKVCIVGRFSPGKSMISPVTKTNCICWQVRVTARKRRTGKKHNVRVTLLRERSKNSFFVADHSATIEVLPMSQQPPSRVMGTQSFFLSVSAPTIKDSLSWGKPFYRISQSFMQKLTDERAIAFLEKHGIRHAGILSDRRSLTIREYLRQAGDAVCISGEIIEKERCEKVFLPTFIYYKPRFFMLAFLVVQLAFSLLFFGVGIIFLILAVLSGIG